MQISYNITNLATVGRQTNITKYTLYNICNLIILHYSKSETFNSGYENIIPPSDVFPVAL